MKEFGNRSALYIIPKSPFKNWAKQYDDDPLCDLVERLNEKHIYLIDFFYQETLEDILEPYYLNIFEYELSSWNTIRTEWPENRSINVFFDWFEVHFCDEIIDLGLDDIETEDAIFFSNPQDFHMGDTFSVPLLSIWPFQSQSSFEMKTLQKRAIFHGQSDLH